MSKFKKKADSTQWQRFDVIKVIFSIIDVLFK
jgi:hypothetical protein